jgi:triacylglycerol lipase
MQGRTTIGVASSVRPGRAAPANPAPGKATQRPLDRGLGFAATPGISDGVVPMLSQVHGRVLHLARADHLDVVGHDPPASGHAGDWLPSGAGFTPETFEATWEAVAAEIARSRRRLDAPRLERASPDSAKGGASPRATATR